MIQLTGSIRHRALDVNETISSPNHKWSPCAKHMENRKYRKPWQRQTTSIHIFGRNPVLETCRWKDTTENLFPLKSTMDDIQPRSLEHPPKQATNWKSGAHDPTDHLHPSSTNVKRLRALDVNETISSPNHRWSSCAKHMENRKYRKPWQRQTTSIHIFGRNPVLETCRWKDTTENLFPLKSTMDDIQPRSLEHPPKQATNWKSGTHDPTDHLHPSSTNVKRLRALDVTASTGCQWNDKLPQSQMITLYKTHGK